MKTILVLMLSLGAFGYGNITPHCPFHPWVTGIWSKLFFAHGQNHNLYNCFVGHYFTDCYKCNTGMGCY